MAQLIFLGFQSLNLLIQGSKKRLDKKSICVNILVEHFEFLHPHLRARQVQCAEFKLCGGT